MKGNNKSYDEINKYDFKLDNDINRYILTIKDFELIK